jgi:RNA polymerase sigma-70 factor, ECF subfamily
MAGGDPSTLAAGAEADPSDESHLVAALCRGDQHAFLTLVERYHTALQRVALSYVGSRALAEEVVQETWLGVVQGINRFEGRSSLKTWIFRILTNRARTCGAREARSITFADLAGERGAQDEPAVDPS